ncbi:MAG: HDIG domain-containing protein [Planctomycetes bacterium]|nr:HDIG domain-containing protein [Planctomycetota bacterium]
MNRNDAFALVCQYTQSDSLRKHMLAVEAAMRAYARKFGDDEDKWGIVGLLHDFDYERWPNPPDHPLKGAEILAQHGYPEDVFYAIKSHADYLTDYPRRSVTPCFDRFDMCMQDVLVHPPAYLGQAEEPTDPATITLGIHKNP